MIFNINTNKTSEVFKNLGGLFVQKYIYTILIFYNFAVYSQSINIQVSNLNHQTVKLFLLSGENLSFVDSINVSEHIFTFQINGEKGFYRIIFDENKWLNFVYDGNDIRIKTDFNDILDSLKIVKSESNKLYYKFLKLNKDYKTKTELLNVILTHYPKDDEYYSISNSKLKSIQNEYKNFINVESQEKPNSFIARYIKSSQLPIIPENIGQQEQLNYLKNHALDNIDFDDAELISSDIFTNKSIEYLTYYRNPQLPKELLEQEFMKAVDTLLNKAKVNQLVYQHITEYLIDGFKKFGFDKIIDYIIENYVIADDLCLDETLENSIEKRIEQSKKLSIGKKVPNIIMPDKDGKVFDLYYSNSEKTLLVFYSTKCPHCVELLPRLKELQNNIEIRSISLDTNMEEWLKFIEENNLTFTHINDPNGWDGDLATDFYIYATPTMFLLDQEKKIIGKPTSYLELMNLL